MVAPVVVLLDGRHAVKIPVSTPVSVRVTVSLSLPPPLMTAVIVSATAGLVF